ncbi:MAG: IS5 family transposase [Coprococcus phoceensis]
MDKQMTISAFSDELAQVRTKKKEFLTQIERIVPWKEWLCLIQPCYYKGERGNKPYPLETMLRLYLLQNLYDLSDEATVAEVIDSRAFSDFCGIDSSNQVPDGDTRGRFRNLLIKNGLQEKLFSQVVAALMERGLILKKGTIVDSTIISAPSSTKNKEKKRDPDAHQVKKGNTWHFGYKAHIGVDRDSGLVHTVGATAANVHDATETSKLLTGDEDEVYGDSGLPRSRKTAAMRSSATGLVHKIKYRINRRPSQVKKAEQKRSVSAAKESRTRKVLCPRESGARIPVSSRNSARFEQTRYRGFEKAESQINIMFALANLILADRPCLAA